MFRIGSMRKARAKRREFSVMALTGKDIWLATLEAHAFVPGMILSRRMNCVYESAMAFRSVVSFVQAEWSTRLMIVATPAMARIAMIAITPINSITVKPE